MQKFELRYIIRSSLVLKKRQSIESRSDCIFIAGVAGNPDAKRLYDDLLSNYNKLVRPVVNVSDPLTVKIKLKLSQLIDVVSYTKYSKLSNASNKTLAYKLNPNVGRKKVHLET